MFKEADSFKTLYLEKLESDTGGLEVFAQDKDTGEILNGMNVTITNNLTGDYDTDYTQFGSTLFLDLDIGEYSVLVEDLSGDHASFSNNSVEVKKDTTETIRAELTPEVKTEIKVKVTEKGALSKPLEGAIVKILSSNGKLIATKNADEQGMVLLQLTEELDEAIINVKKIADEDRNSSKSYLPVSITVTDFTITHNVQLEELTNLNSGRAVVIVKDEDGILLKDAKVFFRYNTTDSIYPLPTITQDFVLTDADGKAKFVLGLAAEKLYPFAVKFPGVSDGKKLATEIDALEENVFELTLNIGDSTINIRAVDSISNAALNGASFEIFKKEGTSITNGLVPLIGKENGEIDYKVKAGQEVYVRITSTGYLEYISDSFTLMPDETYSVLGEMESNIIAFPQVKLEEITQEGKEVSELKRGETYNARFKVIVPDSTYSKALLHFRVGDTYDSDTDALEITEISSGAYKNIERWYKGFNEKIPGSEVSALGKESKWTHITWESANGKVFNANIKFKVKTTEPAGTKLSVYYRMAATKSGGLERDPADPNGAFTSHYTDVSTNVYFKEYFAEKKACSDNYCLSDLDVFDVDSGMYLTSPFKARVLGKNNINFKISNNDSLIYSNLKLIIENIDSSKKAIKMTSGNVKLRASNIPMTFVDEYTSDEIILNNFKKGDTAEISLETIPKETGSAGVKVTLIGDDRVIFREELDFKIDSGKKMDVKLDEELLIAFANNTLEALVFDKETMIPVQDAVVTATIKEPGNPFSNKCSVKTSALGRIQISSSKKSVLFDPILCPAGFNLDSLEPTTKVTLDIEAFDYEEISKELIISDKLVEIVLEPTDLEFNTKTKISNSVDLRIQNLTESEIKVSNMKLYLASDTEGLINYAGINWNPTVALLSPQNELIGGGDEDLITLTVELKKDTDGIILANSLLSENKSTQGELVIELISEPTGLSPKTFKENFIIPIEIKLAEMPENADKCLRLDSTMPFLPDWKAATKESETGSPGEAEISFNLINICYNLGENDEQLPVNLDSIDAEVTWSGNETGYVTVEITDTYGNLASNTMYKDLWYNFHSEMLPQPEVYPVTVKFKSKQLTTNSHANFDVEFRAKVKSENKNTYVKSEKLKADITMVDFERCLKITPEDEIVLSDASPQSEFKIDASECIGDDATMEVIVDLCKGQDFCGGGSADNLGLEVQAGRQHKLNFREKEKTISLRYIEGSYPGLYGIPISVTISPFYAKDPYKYVLVKNEPEEAMAFSLKRYQYYFTGSEKDTVTLTNALFEEKVDVWASGCDWAKQDGTRKTFGGKLWRMAAACMGGALVGTAVVKLLDVIGGLNLEGSGF